LDKAGFNVGQIKKIYTSGKTPSGRALNIIVKSSNGKLEIPSGKFRMAVSPDIIRSAMISDIVRYGEDFEFRGHGWGHGIGLCQWGCKAMGDKKYDYQEILHYYYPGAKVEKWEE
jgi:stage II sporulation protein D